MTIFMFICRKLIRDGYIAFSQECRHHLSLTKTVVTYIMMLSQINRSGSELDKNEISLVNTVVSREKKLKTVFPMILQPPSTHQLTIQ